MIFSSTLSIAKVPHALPSNGGSPHSEPKSPYPDVEPSSPETTGRRTRSNPKLSRWSIARAVRSGRKLNRPVRLPGDELYQSSSLSPVSVEDKTRNGVEFLLQSPRSDVEDVAELGMAAKTIYMVSDGTGWTVEHSVTAALGQFEHCLVDRGCPINTHLFSGVDDMDRLIEIIAQASKEEALIVYTLADPSFAASAKQACEIWGVISLDILGPITDSIASHLGVSPSGLPRWAPQRKRQLGEEYFKRIEAVEFTIKQDDGALPENLHKADLILTGVSRTGKTPLSIYLSQKGYKVANVPIVMNAELPRSLFEENEEKVFALTINPIVLHTIRKARAKSLSFSDGMRSTYSDMDHVRRELEFATKIFQRNPKWPVIEVTGRAIEETAAIILRLFHDRKNKCSMPRISRRY